MSATKVSTTPGSFRSDKAWVVAQTILILATIVSILGPEPDGRPMMWLGLGIALAGFLLVFWAYRVLGDSFTPLPTPPPEAELVARGPYRVVRHPMYAGGITVLLGLSLAFSAIGLVLTAALAVLWFFKARLEERRLAARFPEYADYRRRTWF